MSEPWVGATASPLASDVVVLLALCFLIFDHPFLFSCYCTVPDDIDIALLRRFHSRIFVGPPSHKERIEMIANFMDGIQHCLDDKQVMSLANRIPGWSGSDIKVHLQYDGGCWCWTGRAG